jgi:hypothetical protein
MNPGKSKGCQWTRLYPAIETILLELGDSKDENYWTIELAKEHGIENVRGGDWAQPVLSDRRKKILLDRISDSEE